MLFNKGEMMEVQNQSSLSVQTHLVKEKEKVLHQLLPSCAERSCPLGGMSSEPLLSRSLDGARVASESPVTVKMESDREGRSSCARGAKLSWTICRAV